MLGLWLWLVGRRRFCTRVPPRAPESRMRRREGEQVQGAACSGVGVLVSRAGLRLFMVDVLVYGCAAGQDLGTGRCAGSCDLATCVRLDTAPHTNTEVFYL